MLTVRSLAIIKSKFNVHVELSSVLSAHCSKFDTLNAQYSIYSMFIVAEKNQFNFMKYRNQYELIV